MLRTYAIAAVAGIAAISTACSDDGRVLVMVDSDLDVPGVLATVRARVRGSVGEQLRDFPLTGREGEPGDRAEQLPLSFLVVPREGGANGDVEIVVEAHGSTMPTDEGILVSRRAVTGFIPGRTLVLPLPLLSACVGVTCPEGQTCTPTGCEDARIDPSTLVTTDAPGGELPDAGPVDAGPPCRLWGPFGSAMRASVSTSPELECCPSITADELDLFFMGSRAGYYVMLEATRASPTEPFGPPREVTEVRGAATPLSQEPAISDNGLVLHYQLDSVGGPVYRARRARRDQPFTPEGPIAGPLGATNQWFGVDPAAGGTLLAVTTLGRDLGISTFGGGVFGTPRTLTELEDNLEGWPSLSPDGLTIYYQRSASGDDDDWTIRTATRPSTSAEFVAATELGLGLSADPDITADGDTIWFANGVIGDVDLYYATRECMELGP